MADTKISALLSASALTGVEVIPIVQGGATVKATTQQLATFAHSVAPYLGQVASGCEVPSELISGYKSANYQGVLIAQDDIATLQLAAANFYLNPGNQQETGSGGTLTTRWAVQYPIGSGVWQPLLWSGARDVVILDKAISPLSDALALSTAIPRGAAFLYRRHDEAAGSLLSRNWGSGVNATAWNQNGNQAAFATGANGTSDMTTSTSAIGGGTNYSMPPILVVGQTRRAAALGIGDSRLFGAGDVLDGGGARGNVMRSLDPILATLNAGVSGDTIAGFLTGSQGALRKSLAPYFSNIVSNYGINDVAGNKTAAAIMTNLGAFAALFSTKRVGFCTLEPYTTSTDAWATVANQTLAFSNAQEQARVTVNVQLRSRLAAGQAFVFDIAAALESDLNSGKWAVSGSAPLTGDGLHASYAGNLHVRRSGVVSALVLGRFQP